jgi:hypothetical protein
LKRPGWSLALVALAIHLYASSGYGYFRDELYFIVCGGRPDWGYVDQPPLVPLIAWLMQTLFPGSLVMLRLVPALAHAGTIVLTAETARLLGGLRWAQALAGLSVLVGGVYLAEGTLLVTDVFQPLSWLFIGYALIRLLREPDERWWYAIGIASGVALLSKYMLAFWLVALGVGLLATPSRRLFTRPKLYIAVAITGFIVLPNVLWQAAHDWPFLEIGRVAATGKNIALSPLQFIAAEIETLNMATAPVWLAGLAAFAFWRRFADLRCFAIAFITLTAMMIAMHGKPYYPAGAYPLLFAGGAVALEAWLAPMAVRVALTSAIAVIGVIGAPFALPILPVERFVAYQAMLGRTPKPLEQSPVGRLPQIFSDMFGWPELAALVGRAYQGLPENDRRRAVFLANNYGEAAAIDVFGAAWHLPPAISPHNMYFLWGARGHDGSVVIRLGGTRDALLKTYDSVEPAGAFDDPWAMPYETGRTVWICRGRKVPLDVAWPKLRNYG